MMLFPDFPTLNHRNENIRHAKFFSYGDIRPNIFSYLGYFFYGKLCLPGISALFGLCRPATVARRIAAIIVDAIYRSSYRTLAHVSEKILKAVPPAVADRNASRAVFLEVREIRVRAAGNHRDPSVVGGGFLARSCVPVGCSFASSAINIAGHCGSSSELLCQGAVKRVNAFPSRLL
jgi:hypothetical protein